MKKIINCELCNKTSFKFIGTVKKFKSPFNMVKCNNCDLVFMNPQYTQKELNSFYDEDYYSGKSDFSYYDERNFIKGNSLMYESRIKNIEKILGKKGKILEIGSSFGVFLNVCKKKGWNETGVEISKYSADYSKEHFKLNIINDDFFNTKKLEKYDVIIMCDVIEHIARPNDFFKKCYSHLNKNGLIILETADFDSIISKLRGISWGYYLPGHPIIYSRNTLRKMLKKNGFKKKKEYFGDEISLFSKIKCYKKNYGSLFKLDFIKFLFIKIIRQLNIFGKGFGGMVYYYEKK